ncbi:hypothetical protein [Actinoplanes couchii]|uniref:Uncharacterized protein n=1 Tax=Actinoplanes couchii TaxID=403638 RepID=A0ABQ3X1P4_9ACTN|nr:hypothetical protein [Actinoplanes couchii]MDR6316825.1 hypothetical protein [Actinoplanes couchii]GID52432.1 hypothetical protein Aco03nite_008360 [Actinoplanes couchii]
MKKVTRLSEMPRPEIEAGFRITARLNLSGCPGISLDLACLGLPMIVLYPRTGVRGVSRPAVDRSGWAGDRGEPGYVRIADDVDGVGGSFPVGVPVRVVCGALGEIPRQQDRRCHVEALR